MNPTLGGRILRTLLPLFTALFLLAPSALFAAPILKLAVPPVGERWFSVNVNGERVGFAHLIIKAQDGGYRIFSDGSVKMKVMGFSREASSKETYLVGPDLALKSFTVEQHMDGSPMQISGEASPGGIRVSVDSGGKKKERTLKTKGAVFPPQALNILPLLRGAEKGKKYRVSMLDAESVKVKEIKVEVIGEENGAAGKTLHLRNNLFPMVDNDIWVDWEGNTVKESVRDDLVVTLAEDEQKAKSALADAALAKKDLVLDFSLIKTEPIAHPGRLNKLVLEITGIPADFPLINGERQSTERVNGKVRFTMPPQSPSVPEASRPEDLEPASRIPSDAPEIIAQQKAILDGAADPAEAVRRLVTWVAKEIKGTVIDSQSPLETLEKKNGNCQAHARLYAALARSAAIPTRFVSGLVYSPGQGFLYHSWDESYVDKHWVPVDPTFGEVPANLTHVKLVEGDTPDEMSLIAGVIGMLKARVVEQTESEREK